MVAMMNPMTAPGMGLTGPTPGMGMGGTMPGMMGSMAPNMVMVPRCAMRMEKCAGGMRITCTCDDAAACAMMQNLCQAMAGGMVSVCCTLNGMTVCCCNLTCGLCKCEMTKDGCVVTCTSGDKACEAMIQGCCDCLTACMAAGCACCLMMGGTPVCCCTC